MFELIGIFDWTSEEEEKLSELALPALEWGEVNNKICTIKANGLIASYAEHYSTEKSYYSKNGIHLFIVGEARLRADAPERYGNNYCSLLSASNVYDLIENQKEGFIKYLKGNYILIVVYLDSKQIIIYNSRFGIIPFYYTINGRKAIFSTSILAILKNSTLSADFDQTAVTELALFNYPIGERTYIKGVKMLQPAERIFVNESIVKKERYWDLETLYKSKLLSDEEALETGAILFHKTVNDYVKDMPRIRLSFTSGFDSRAILSALEKDWKDYLCYSFGTPQSLNVTIPKIIAEKIGFEYKAVLLEDEYEKDFDNYAFKALMLSDCLSTVERANYPYAFEKLADYSPVVITGLFGSELLRTFQNVGWIVSSNLVRLNSSEDPEIELSNLLNEDDIIRYFLPEFLRGNMAEVASDLNSTLWEPFGEMPSDKRFYMFLLTEGLRKYFGAELQMERPFAINRTPFLDDEFVEYLFRAPFAGVYSRTLNPTISNRYRSQYFYAYIIRKYNADLLEIDTDHGYSPRDVLSRIAPINMGIKQLISRRYRKRVSYREFKTEEWTAGLYKRYLKKGEYQWVTQFFLREFESGEWLNRRLEFARAASYQMWFEKLTLMKG